jgi:hypothetical protein
MQLACGAERAEEIRDVETPPVPASLSAAEARELLAEGGELDDFW